MFKSIENWSFSTSGNCLFECSCVFIDNELGKIETNTNIICYDSITNGSAACISIAREYCTRNLDIVKNILLCVKQCSYTWDSKPSLAEILPHLKLTNDQKLEFSKYMVLL